MRVVFLVTTLFSSLAMAAALTEVPLPDVKLADGFWKQKLDTNRTATVWHNFHECETTGRIRNFERVARHEKGKQEGLLFNDSDVYKVMEGASYILAGGKDEKLDKYLDDLIATMAAAQMPDGYLYTKYQLEGIDQRFTNLKDMHEMYCAGHLIEAGVAHHRATGKRALLDVAIKFADLLDSTFGPDKRHDVCGHEEIELALVKLSDETGEAKYRKLADFFVHLRGRPDARKSWGDYHQDARPLEEADQVVGHAVRQMYFLCAAADVTSHGDADYTQPMHRLWQNLVERKMYITGGVGAKHEGEAFGDPYELPNESAYAETCAAIGSALWNHRMNLLTGDAKYADVVERASYNGILSGVSLSGDKFFYVNPLASKGGHHRQAWYDCACCPPNVLRYFASLPSRAYASDADGNVYVNLYAAGEGRVIRPGGEIRIKQETDYPRDGKVKLTINPEPAVTCAIKLRIPSWCEGASIAINGKSPGFAVVNGYAIIHGDWHAGDTIELNLPMPIKRVHADERVKDDVGCVAVQRGPIVYCAEAVDNGGKAMDLSLPAGEALRVERAADLLGGVNVIKGKSITLVPYYAWDNRAAGEMAVWLAESSSK
jgi:DUF1680 family protein